MAIKIIAETGKRTVIDPLLEQHSALIISDEPYNHIPFYCDNIIIDKEQNLKNLLDSLSAWILNHHYDCLICYTNSYDRLLLLRYQVILKDFSNNVSFEIFASKEEI